MRTRLLALAIAAALTLGCEGSDGPGPFVIPGPTVPSAIPTTAPYVWDSREELTVWINNGVSRGSMAIDGSGLDAVIRLDRPDSEWVLRGPDLAPVPNDVRSAKIRYRWRPDPSLGPNAVRTMQTAVHFETSSPLQPYYFGQASATAQLQPADTFVEISFIPGQFTPPIDVRYFYFHSFGANRGVLEIDRIELVR